MKEGFYEGWDFQMGIELRWEYLRILLFLD